MDERAAVDYLKRLFGTHRGYVVLAVKTSEKKDGWTEKSFNWPSQKAEILRYAAQRGDVFICPALRKNSGRRKGDGAYLQWLWADVDMQRIPEKQRPLIRQRISRVGTYVVRSGSGENSHVYTKLSKPVTLEVWRRLNQGLRDYLQADNKHTDNALLRLPGTTNHKPGAGVVEYIGGEGPVRVPEKLLKLKVWQAVVVNDDLPTSEVWETVPVSKLLKGGVKALVTMESDEATGRYGSRHAAVYRVTATLSKRGFTPDQIHSLMANFIPGLEKEADERGYDMHADIGRCLVAHPPKSDSPFTEIPEDEDDPREDEINRKVKLKLLEWEATKRARELESSAAFTLPDPKSYGSLTDLMDLPLNEAKYLLGGRLEADKGIIGEQHNVVLIAQWKSGKTTLAADLAKSLVDGDPFLGAFPVSMPQSVAFWSLEVEIAELLRDYIFPLKIKNTDNMHIWDGVGRPVNILSEPGKQWTIHWLKSRGIKVWMIDSLSVLAVWTGVNIDKDNTETKRLFATIDEIKREAGVDVSFVLAHTPRTEMEEGKERARGASAIDEHAGARWLLTMEGDVRFLRVNGRGVHLPTTSLTWDGARNKLGVEGKAASRTDAGVQLVKELVTDAEGKLNSTALRKRIVEVLTLSNLPHGADAVSQLMREAVDCNFIEWRPGDKPGSKIAWLTPDTGRVSPRIIDMSKASDGPRRGRRPAAVRN